MIPLIVKSFHSKKGLRVNRRQGMGTLISDGDAAHDGDTGRWTGSVAPSSLAVLPTHLSCLM